MFKRRGPQNWPNDNSSEVATSGPAGPAASDCTPAPTHATSAHESSNANELLIHKTELFSDSHSGGGSSTGAGSGGSRRGRTLHTVAPSNFLTSHYFSQKPDYSTSSQSELTVVIDEEGSLQEKKSEVPERIFIRTHEYINAATLALMLLIFGWTAYNVTTTIVRLQMYYAFAVLAVLPVGMISFARRVALSTVVRGIMSVGLGGTSPLDRNSQNYSAIKTPVPPGAKLPQIIVQMPVYKESLEKVIKPTYFNVKRAMDYYRSKGGEVKYIICDDGFQVIPTEEAVARSSFYEKHKISFVARPPENRGGVFKKASNLNYQLAVSDRIGDFMSQEPLLTPHQALLMTWDERDREFVAAGDLSMDDNCLILLIDADTKVPEHCMYDVVGEFITSPEVAYTQHFTTPFEEQNRNYWEQYISQFTRIIYMQGIAVVALVEIV